MHVVWNNNGGGHKFSEFACFAYLILYTYYTTLENLNELVHEISNNVVCVTSNAQTSLIRAFASDLNII